MALEFAQRDAALSGRRARRTVLVIAGAVGAALALLAAVVLLLSGVSLASDSVALARIDARPLAGTVTSVAAFGPHGRRIPLALQDDRLTPLHKLRPGEQISVEVKVRRPGWIGWALGTEAVEHLSLRTPVAAVSEPWLTLARGSALRVSFDAPVRAVAYGGDGRLARRSLTAPAQQVSLGAQSATGTLRVATAPRSWETFGVPEQLSWFPPARDPVLASLPAPGADTGPSAPIYLTFSKPLTEVLGSARPRISPAVPGRWREVNSHTLVFKPRGFGAPMGSELRLQLPHTVQVTSGAGGGLRATNEIDWFVPPGSTLRLQQLLAQAGYLPVVWRPAGGHVARTASAEVAAAVAPPSGSFSWRYGDTPAQLQALWAPGRENVITRGAIMKFENANGLTVDGVAGAGVWRSLFDYAIAGKRFSEPYSYVYVHREVPETATLWSAGRTVITSPANTGISGAETALGTYPVFEHIAEGTMSGTNPDGSHYEDPGIKWISYFNGGDALHYFDRASFGFQQSLGCVELPLAAAAEIWPYTPIGTLVSVEG